MHAVPTAPDWRGVVIGRLAPLWWRGGGWASGTFFPKDDPSLLQVIGGHFDPDPVAHDGADAKFAHLPRRVSDDPMIVFQHDAEPPIGVDFIDLALEGQ